MPHIVPVRRDGDAVTTISDVEAVDWRGSVHWIDRIRKHA